MSHVPRTIEWIGGLDGHVAMIDQTLLPHRLVMLRVEDVETMWADIRRLAVRGAPAIGIAAAMGLVLGIRGSAARTPAELLNEVVRVASYLASSRPTAVNLRWALDRMRRRADETAVGGVEAVKAALLAEAKAIRDEDAALCRAIGEHGARLIPGGGGVLTICNAGSLATAEFGTALAPMYVAHERGVRFQVYALETRPLLQGARLTVWELSQAGVPCTLLCDSAAASLLRSGRVQVVLTGADRIAANGDTANKIGTYGLACLARDHGVPFYVAAPHSTFDLSLADGGGIPIEERSADEVRGFGGQQTVPEGVSCLNPAFDVTPAGLIRGLVTDRGLIEPVKTGNIRSALP
ncbi:MAG: S-methyl-5-thioribose-1-phosphate isomerase [Phycisphaerae bacterium]|nr:MAG: S-methyl-5-thioribose-1-phosphate isomerase [Planctomycetota bacterium]KAB2940355.1 MAG: S-methyl-5-thioribose-1-phosphate isomerase [Phycisphaerae bacterium]MBE7457665.1 S-methyl-5-thioribose-1-phosphate isomerase [Planctomycetia bacterium]MCK6463818.1 S-methyl-5-thioribose-1-phosphate isomerase [Phycisphaerae bacterium]MCL4717467.1 S-methyl-5-thioribose-1-phosphate isomerase [Phycisphaerae bacterium]